MLKAIYFQRASTVTDDFYLPFSISFPEFAFKRQFGCMLPKLDILILILAYYCNNFQTNKVGGGPSGSYLCNQNGIYSFCLQFWRLGKSYYPELNWLSLMHTDGTTLCKLQLSYFCPQRESSRKVLVLMQQTAGFLHGKVSEGGLLLQKLICLNGTCRGIL